MSPPRSNPNRRRFRRFLFGAAWVPVLILAALALLGLPRPVRLWAQDQLAAHGVFVEADAILYRPDRGWTARNVRLYAPQDRVTPSLVFSATTFRVRWWRGLRRGIWTGRVHATGGRLETELGMWTEDLVTRQAMSLTQINARIALTAEDLVLHSIQARLADIRLELAGRIALSDLRGKPSDDSPPATDVAARWLAQVVQALGDIEFTPAARCGIQFKVDSRSPTPIEASLSLDFEGEGLVRGVSVSAGRLHARYDGETVRGDELAILTPDGDALHAHGWLALSNRVAFLQATNSLPRYTLEHLLPFSLSDLLQSLDLRSEGLAEFSMTLGPSPLDSFGHDLSGWLRMTDVYYMEAYFPQAAVDLSYRDDALVLTNLVGVAGRGTDRGPIKGSVLYHFGDGRLSIDLQGEFDPLVLVSLVPPATEKAIREWDFPGHPPQLQLQVDRENRESPLFVDARVEARDLVLRGTNLDALSGRFLLDERYLILTNLVAERGVERLEGWLRKEFHGDLLWLEVHSSLDPPSLARLAGSESADTMGLFRFKGTNLVEISGQFDLSPLHRNRLSASARLEDVAWNWVQLDDLVLGGELNGQTLVIPVLYGRAVDGTVQGSFTATQFLTPEESSFALQFKTRELDLFQVITAATDSTNTPYNGKLSLDLTLWGNLADRDTIPRTDSLLGQGSLAVKEGTLFRIPLLFGLSHILSGVVRGFGYAEQTDFTADFRIGEGRVQSDNLFLSGRLLSISGQGHLGFDRRLRANMKIQLLNEGFFSDALKLLLWPIRKLIEIQATGSLDEPDWQPRNLPKELFGK